MDLIKGPFRRPVIQSNLRFKNSCGTGSGNTLMPLITEIKMKLIEMRLGDQEMIHGDAGLGAAISPVEQISDSSSRTLSNMKMSEGQ